MGEQLISTSELSGLRVISEKKGSRIGKVRRFVFHPTEKRCVGFLVKRPDAALMFHRKDLFVALDGFRIEKGTAIVNDADPTATDRGAIKRLGLNWDACVIWVGMPVHTVSGKFIGHIDSVTFNRDTGAVDKVAIDDGAANNVILGKRVLPAKLVKGFKAGRGGRLVTVGDYDDESALADSGAILVADEALEAPIEGGAAAAAGKATAVATDKAKKGAVRAKTAVDDRVQKAKPHAQKAAEQAGKAVDAGAFAVGKQLGKATGMFSAFKEEYDKAAHGGESE